MFHIEDVWDTSGVKDPTITMPMLINNFVDLTARPICVNFEPDKLLETQKDLIEEKSAYGEIPLLQASMESNHIQKVARNCFLLPNRIFLAL